MTKIADLYIRVSTDEQADKGYSQRSQAEVLTRYCEINKILVRQVIYEDHSAKTFMRPEWQKLLVTLKKQKGRTNLVLFTKWDRFSRNAPDAYQMINTLKVLGVEPQAIEQPLDMSVPENKMMLAIYLTAPEIENDRRALNTFYGLRRARKEGRWTSKAPVGYKNLCTPDGKKYIAPDEKQGKLMQWVFEELASGKYTASQVFWKAKELGLACKRNRYFQAIRNPVYCGRIYIEPFGDEQGHTVKALHEGVISETVFYQAQAVIDGKTRQVFREMMMLPELLPLKTLIRCSKCNRMLCASASKGRTGNYYHYYHCSNACGYRQKAEVVNQAFLDELDRYTLREEVVDDFRTAIIDSYAEMTNQERGLKLKLIAEITDNNNRVTKARELLLSGDIDGDDYKTIKSDSEQKIRVLEEQLALMPIGTITVGELSAVLEKALPKLTAIKAIFQKGSADDQKEMVVSMFPKKFSFDELKARNMKVSGLYNRIYQINSTLDRKKRRASDRKTCLPSVAPEAGLEPATL